MRTPVIRSSERARKAFQEDAGEDAGGDSLGAKAACPKLPDCNSGCSEEDEMTSIEIAAATPGKRQSVPQSVPRTKKSKSRRFRARITEAA